MSCASANGLADDPGGAGASSVSLTHSEEVSAGTAGPCDPAAAAGLGP